MFDLTLPARTPLPQPPFLPTTRAEMDAIGWDSLDILLVTGDAYVDHPSFGVPLLGRWLVGHGYRVGIVAQPRWKDEGQGIADLARMGRPRLFAGVSAGALDSMLAHYTAFRKKRHDDAYTPGGEAGSRPNRAVIVYAGLIRKAFPGLPCSPEASKPRSAASPITIFGPTACAVPSCSTPGWTSFPAAWASAPSSTSPGGSTPWPNSWAICPCWSPWMGSCGRTSGPGFPGTARLVKTASIPSGAEELDGLELVRLPSHDEMLAVPRAYLDGTVRLERETHQSRRILAQPNGDRTVLLMPPAAPLTTEELDGLYALPFSRRPHPSYKEPIPAVEMIATSITTHRGCGGGCSFCSLALHQGRRIASRSEASILDEAKRIAAMPRGGSISDVGGPSANMWGAACRLDPSKCRRDSCMYPSICKGFSVDQRACIDLLPRRAGHARREACPGCQPACASISAASRMPPRLRPRPASSPAASKRARA